MKIRLLKQRISFLTALFKAKITKRKVPLSVILCVTNQCNLNCKYCYGEHPYRGSCYEFTTDDLLNIVRELKKLGTQQILFQGGEPLLREDLPVILSQVRKFGMYCDMVTNGMLLTLKPEVLSFLDSICISLDGPEPINDRNRGEGSYKGAVEAIKFAGKLNFPVRLSTVLTELTTKDSIDWLVAFAREYRCMLNFSPSFDFVKNYHPGEFRPHVVSDEQLRSLFKHIIYHKHNGAPIQFSLIGYNIALQWPFSYNKHKIYRADISKNVNFQYPKCYHGDYVVFIDSEGSVYPCCNFWGQPKLNIREHSVAGAIKALSRDGCQACYTVSYIDRNLFFDMDLRVWWNYLVQNFKEAIK